MSHPEIEYLGRAGGVYVRRLHFVRAGDVHAGHSHKINHVTLIHSGKVRCEVEGHPPLEADAGTWLTIDKDTHHKFTALEDDTTYFCIFSLYDETGKIEAPRDDVILGQCFGCPIACEAVASAAS